MFGHRGGKKEQYITRGLRHGRRGNESNKDDLDSAHGGGEARERIQIER
jgi:hypothetical protein